MLKMTFDQYTDLKNFFTDYTGKACVKIRTLYVKKILDIDLQNKPFNRFYFEGDVIISFSFGGKVKAIRFFKKPELNASIDYDDPFTISYEPVEIKNFYPQYCELNIYTDEIFIYPVAQLFNFGSNENAEDPDIKWAFANQTGLVFSIESEKDKSLNGNVMVINFLEGELGGIFIDLNEHLEKKVRSRYGSSAVVF